MIDSSAPDFALRGARILVVEDDMLVAMLLEDLLNEHGCALVGPAARLARAMDLAAVEIIDAALLDLNVDGKQVYPVAEILRKRGIPFAFVTGYGANWVSSTYRDRPTLQKPFRDAALANVLRLLLPRPADRRPPWPV